MYRLNACCGFLYFSAFNLFFFQFLVLTIIRVTYLKGLIKILWWLPRGFTVYSLIRLNKGLYFLNVVDIILGIQPWTKHTNSPRGACIPVWRNNKISKMYTVIFNEKSYGGEKVGWSGRASLRYLNKYLNKLSHAYIWRKSGGILNSSYKDWVGSMFKWHQRG